LHFGQGYQGPGFCRTVGFNTAHLGVCVGIPTFGAPCNDGNGCTKNDKCKVDDLFSGVCQGKLDTDVSCSDFDDACTINDR
jgi:hypothetical protein